MAPVRRYLRITKHSVLEVRIYLDRPADAEAWLLKRDDPALPRVIAAIRPLVLPKLREENERARGKNGAKSKKKGVKDVVVEADFEVSIFLTELSSRHSVLTKQKIFRNKPRIQSNSGKLTNWLATGTIDQPVVISEDGPEAIVIPDEEDEATINLADIPEIDTQPQHSTQSMRSKKRGVTLDGDEANESDESGLFVPRATSKRENADVGSDDNEEDDSEEAQDDKKKLNLNTSYDGFSIYGRILCLVVKRRGVKTPVGNRMVPASSQVMLENWVSTQASLEQVGDDEDNS